MVFANVKSATDIVAYFAEYFFHASSARIFSQLFVFSLKSDGIHIVRCPTQTCLR